MTLIVALANKDYVIQISDRRLTTNGRLMDDESNKSSVIFSTNARLACGFTGLAKAGRFDTQKWLLSALHASAPPDFTIGESLNRFTAAATQKFKNDPDLRNVPKAHKRLAFMFSGFVNYDGNFRPGCAIVSNFFNFEENTAEDIARDEFTARYQTARPEVELPTLVQRVGNWHGMRSDDESVLREMLSRGLPASAVVGKAVEIVREIAGRAASQGLIGKQLTAVVVPKSLDRPIESGYYSDKVRPETFMPSHVYLLPDQHLVVDAISIRPVEADTLPLSVPKVRRKMPCPCGSGKKYKHCHGRLAK